MPTRIPADAPIDVFLAKSLSDISAAGIAPPYVAILPDYQTWNDYGLTFLAYIAVVTKDAEPDLKMPFRLMFQGASKTPTVMNELFTSLGKAIPIEKVERHFISLIPELGTYQRFIQALGLDRGIAALRKLHDAVVTEIEADENDPTLAMSETQDFHLGMLRADGAYSAMRRASRFFRSGQPPKVDDSIREVDFKAKLKSADNEYEVVFRFGDEAIWRNRFAVLIGKNGAGKTQFLNAIVRSMFAKAEIDTSAAETQFEAARVLVFSSVPTDPFPRFVGAWEGIDYEYFAVNSARERGVDPLLEALVDLKRGDDDTLLGPKKNLTRLQVAASALRPLDLWDKLYLPLRPRDDLGNEIPGLLHVDERDYFAINRPHMSEMHRIQMVQRIDWDAPPVIFDETMQPRQLSSGEYAILRFVVQVAAAIEQGSLLLIDEPETHLHPNLVSELMTTLDDLLRATNSVAIIATHSAYVVREVPRSCVNVFRLKDRQIDIGQPRRQTFGASIDAISQFVFDDGSIPHGFEQVLTDWVDRTGRDLGLDEIIRSYSDELNAECLSFIAQYLENGRSSSGRSK